MATQLAAPYIDLTVDDSPPLSPAAALEHLNADLKEIWQVRSKPHTTTQQQLVAAIGSDAAHITLNAQRQAETEVSTSRLKAANNSAQLPSREPSDTLSQAGPITTVRFVTSAHSTQRVIKSETSATTFPPIVVARVPQLASSMKRTADGQLKVSSEAPSVRTNEQLVNKEKLNHNSLDSPSMDKVGALISRSANVANTSSPTYPGQVSRSSEMVHAGDNDMTKKLTGEMIKTLPSGFASPYTKAEDNLIIHLKRDRGLDWPEISQYFPHRPGSNTIRTHWYAKISRHLEVPSLSTRPSSMEGSRCQSEDAIPSGQNFPYHQPVAHRATAMTTTRLLRTSTRLSKQYYPETGLWGLDMGDEDEIEADGYATMSTENIWKANEGQLVHHPASVLIEDRQCKTNPALLADEADRDSAALTSMTPKIHRPTAIFATLPRSRRSPKQHKRKSVDVQRPYLRLEERTFLERSADEFWDDTEILSWNGKVLHVDFTDEEIEGLEASITAVRGRNHISSFSPPHSRVVRALRGVSDVEIHQISWHAQTHGNSFHRTTDSIEGFLHDASQNHINNSMSYRRIGLHWVHDRRNSAINSCLQTRELGLCANKTRHPVSVQVSKRSLANLKSHVYATLGPRLRYTGTSGDVNAVAWAPNGEYFAAGSTALTDPHSMQYNEPNNLLLGSLNTETLYELPDHAIVRKRTSSGINLSSEMYASQDSLLFQTISTVAFSPDSRLLFSAGYDKYARLWAIGDSLDEESLDEDRVDEDRLDKDCLDEDPLDEIVLDGEGLNRVQCVLTVKVNARIDLLAVNHDGLFATGAQESQRSSVQVVRYDLNRPQDELTKASFFSPRAKESPDSNIVPSCLRWGNNFGQQYLLGGYSSNVKDYGPGETCIWDVAAAKLWATIGSRNVFDAAWSPNVFGRFAVGCSAGGNVNKGTRAVVRLHDSRLVSSSPQDERFNVNKHYTIELECPALDMNDVVFNPYDDNMVSVGCTDAMTYIWDLRNPDVLMHRFQHGIPLMELDKSRCREEVDTGIRFLSWGHSHRRVYTGSSDGVVAAWDAYLSEEDACIRCVTQLNSGVMSGAFSPDFSSLVVGEVNGTISMVTVGHEDETWEDCKPFSLRPAETRKAQLRKKLNNAQHHNQSLPSDVLQPNEMTGIDISRELVSSKQIRICQFGDLPIRQAVQGSDYHGPVDKQPGNEALRAEAEQFQSSFRPSREPCRVKGCNDILKITQEEHGDSGAWKSRIPEHIRQFGVSQKVGFTCLRCKANQPEKTTDNVDTENVGTKKDTNSAENQTESMHCPQCKATWQMDILGYSILNDTKPTTVARKLEPKNLDIDQRSIYYHYHSLWQDRPPSPL